MLCADLRNTLTLEEFEAIRDLMEDQLKVLAKKLQKVQRGGTGPVQVQAGDGSAAGMRQISDQHAHCLSCDRPLNLQKE